MFWKQLIRSRVVPLMASFQDHQNLYLIMDYMPGGDFLGLLIRYVKLTLLVSDILEEPRKLHRVYYTDV